MIDNKKFQRFGKYLILDHLVDGGMAKICRARYLGEQANKMVAVKMVQPQFSNDEAFVRMFQDELNITFGMLHPNIMQVYDYGKTNGQLYTAMEYIHGANLKQYLNLYPGIFNEPFTKHYRRETYQMVLNNTIHLV